MTPDQNASLTLLDVRGLTRRFGGNLAVDQVAFDMAPGEMVALIGPNGAGKSTTFNMLNGQLAADTGSVRLLGQELLGLSPRRIARLGVGRTFQIAATFTSLSVAENVQVALLSHHRRLWNLWRPARHALREQALALLAQVGMREQADRPCSELAYGDVKRVELAISLAGDPRLLLMDEPTAGMAPAERKSLMALVRDLAQARGMGVLFTEHSMDVVFAYADRIIVLARGRVIARGTADEVRDDPQVQAVYFGSGKTFTQALPDTARGGSPDASADNVAHFSSDMAHRSQAPTDPTDADHPSLSAPTFFSADRLNAWYGAARILHDVSLSVGRGEVVALMGRNGAGKSTTLKALMGLVARRTGSVRYQGRDLAGLPPYRIARLGLGYVPEERRIFTELTVRENLLTGVQPARHGPDGSQAPQWTLERVLDLFPHLAALAQRMAGQLSGGEQQMLTVARSLMGNPGLILLDEPSEGVAPIIVEQMAAMILTLKEAGVSVLLSEQNLQFAGLVCERAYVLEKGVLRHEGPLRALMQDTALLREYLSI